MAGVTGSGGGGGTGGGSVAPSPQAAKTTPPIVKMDFNDQLDRITPCTPIRSPKLFYLS